jgi:DHA2 family multidrug resistance protein
MASVIPSTPPAAGARDYGRAWITAVIMTAAIMQIVDTTIVVVALPHMEGQLSASPDQITWVLTSYLVSSGIMMPLTGYFTDRLGQRRYLLLSIAGFVAASALCGLAASLDEIVAFRLLQGVAGAGLMPLAQAILVNLYPGEERGRAMAIFGVGAMVGPILGPTLGGYLTQVLSWRWTFFINVPIGIVAFLGTWIMVPESRTRARSMDWTGFGFLVLAVSAMQYALDHGTQYGWFGSRTIQIAVFASALGFAALIANGIARGRGAAFDLGLFRDRNYAASSLVFVFFIFSMYGMLALQPMFMESLLDYPTLTTGLVLAPRGLASMLSMLIAGRLINRFGARPLIVVGVLCTSLGTLATTGYDLDVDTWWLVWPLLLQGFGLGFVFVPLGTVAFATLRPDQSAEAAGVRQLVRTIAASIGTAASTAVATRESQVTWNQLRDSINPYNEAVARFLSHLHLHEASHRAAALLGQVLGRQTAVIGMLDAFKMFGLSLLITLPLLLLMKDERKGAAAAPAD